MNSLAQANTADKTRVIKLEGQTNFRDIGGYMTKDGKTLKMGKVYRSGELQKLTDEDVKKLEELEINVLVNFLIKDEIEKRGRDRLPERTKEVFVPIESDGATELVKEVLGWSPLMLFLFFFLFFW